MLDIDNVCSKVLAGRFFRSSSPLERGTSLYDWCVRDAWSDDPSFIIDSDGSVYPCVRGFCSHAHPYDGDLESDASPLAYADDDTGVWRLAVREETRAAPRSQIVHVAERLALADDPSTPLKALRGREKGDVMDRARQDVLKSALPKRRLFPVIVIDDLVWIGARSGQMMDRSMFLTHALGVLAPDAMVLGDGVDWYSTTMAIVEHVIRQGPQLAPGVEVTEMSLKGKKVSVRTTQLDETRPMLEALDTAGIDSPLKRFKLTIFRDGHQVLLDVDERGLKRVHPARSRGGLPHEQIRRRFEDVEEVCARVREVFADLVEAAS